MLRNTETHLSPYIRLLKPAVEQAEIGLGTRSGPDKLANTGRSDGLIYIDTAIERGCVRVVILWAGTAQNGLNRVRDQL